MHHELEYRAGFAPLDTFSLHFLLVYQTQISVFILYFTEPVQVQRTVLGAGSQQVDDVLVLPNHFHHFHFGHEV